MGSTDVADPKQIGVNHRVNMEAGSVDRVVVVPEGIACGQEVNDAL